MIVIDAGNTNIVIGFYTKNKFVKIIRLKTEKKINITKKEINKFFKSNKKLINNLKDNNQEKKFKYAHGLSVVINFVQIIGLIYLLI